MVDYRKFSKKELTNILDAINSALACRAEEDLRDLLGSIRGLVCGDYGICGVGKGDQNGLFAAPRIINLNYPEEWLHIYGSNELYFDDPIVLRNLKEPGPQIWDETYSLFNERLTDLLMSSRDFGISHGVSGGLYASETQTTTLFSFSGKGKWFQKHQKEILEILSPHLHQALLRVCKTLNRDPRVDTLSEREKEIIRWVKVGKTNWEISVILNISERTVKFHVQNIERKLDAVNKAHAVAILMEHGRLE